MSNELIDENDPEIIAESALATAQALLSGALRDTNTDTEPYAHLLEGSHDLTIRELAKALHGLGWEIFLSGCGEVELLANSAEVARLARERDALREDAQYMVSCFIQAQKNYGRDSLWTTGAGHYLKPGFDKLAALLAPPSTSAEVASEPSADPAKYCSWCSTTLDAEGICNKCDYPGPSADPAGGECDA